MFSRPSTRRAARWLPLFLALLMALVAAPRALVAAPCTITVQRGDTLGAIAARNGTTVRAILQANPAITNPNLIRVGQTVRLPNCAPTAGPTQPTNPATPPAPPTPSAPTSVQPLPAPPADLAPALWQRAHDATITIRHPVGAPIYSGSGIVVGNDGRTFLTAFHVIGDARTGEQVSRVAVGPFGEWRFTADVLAADPDLDLAVLRVNEPDFPGFAVAPLGSSSALRLGAPVYTLSYPGIEGALVAGKGHYLTQVQSLTNRSPLLVTDAHAYFGSSGGVAVNERGEVIGIITGGIIGRDFLALLGYPTLSQATLLVPIDAAADLLRQAGVR